MNKNLNFMFSSIERTGVNERFLYNGYTAWPKMKNHIFISLLPGNSNSGPSFRDNLNIYGIYLLFLSFFNVLKTIFRSNATSIYHGAQSTLSLNCAFPIDSHFPCSLSRDSTISVLNTSNSRRAFIARRWLKDKNVIVDNYILWMLRAISSPFFKAPSKDDIVWLQNQLLAHDIYLSDRYLVRIYKSFCINQYFWLIYLKCTKVINAYVISSYSKSDFVAACRILDIKVFEIQHGLVGEEHRGYNYVCSNNNLPVPDYIYVYDEFWKEKLISAGFYKKDNVIVSQKEFPKNEFHQNDYPAKFILFTGQGIFFQEIKAFAEDISSWLRSTDQFLLYKPHPREADSQTDILNGVDRLVIYRGTNSAETLIEKCSAHISFYSTCHYSAVKILGQTFVLESPSSPLIMDNIGADFVKFRLIYDAKDFIDAQLHV